METYKRIGKIIQEYRKEAKISQEALGDELGYTATAISYFENGLRKIGIEDLQKIAEFLKIPLEYLLFSKEKEEEKSSYILKLRAAKNLSPTTKQSIVEFINFAKQKNKDKK